MTDIRKLFKFAAEESERNKECFEVIERFIQEKIIFAESNIKAAVREYQNGYMDTKYHIYNVDAANRNNRRLLASVKSAQRQYKKYLAIQKAYYATIK